MKYENDLILRAARGEKTERLPVWLMRQAGRILPEYRAVRGKLSGFIELATTPELAAEVTLQPVDLLGVDAAIIFSDILVIPEAMGLPYELIEKKGPYFPHTIQSEAAFRKLKKADPESDLGYVMEAIRICKKELGDRLPLIGFAGAPFTIFCYMVEGGGSKTFSIAKRMLYQKPALAHEILQLITDSTIAYLKSQISVGADIVQVFDSWAGILSPEQYRIFSIPYLKQICDAIDEVPVTLFAKGAWFALADLGKLSCNTIGLDWHTTPAFARKQIGQNYTLQGNLDPCALYGSDAEVVKQTRQMLDSFGFERHIANLGHGVYPDTDPEKVKVFIEEVKSYSAGKNGMNESEPQSLKTCSSPW